MTPPQERFRTPVTGPAYRWSAKVTSVLTVLSLVVYGIKTSEHMVGMAWSMWVLLAAAFGGVVVTTWYILTGHTTVDAQGVHQDWMASKSYRWDQIKRARHVRLPFTSRLMLSTGFGPAKAIQSGTPELDAAFREIAAYYRARAAAQAF